MSGWYFCPYAICKLVLPSWEDNLCAKRKRHFLDVLYIDCWVAGDGSFSVLVSGDLHLLLLSSGHQPSQHGNIAQPWNDRNRGSDCSNSHKILSVSGRYKARNVLGCDNISCTTSPASTRSSSSSHIHTENPKNQTRSNWDKQYHLKISIHSSQKLKVNRSNEKITEMMTRCQ